jgi:lipopolysaccharide transport system permease protein
MKSLTYRIDLIRHLVWRDFVLRYKGSVLGVLWYLLPPLAQLLVLVFLFGRVVPLNIEAYPAFVFCGLLPWTWFSTCLNSGGYPEYSFTRIDSVRIRRLSQGMEGETVV